MKGTASLLTAVLFAASCETASLTGITGDRSRSSTEDFEVSVVQTAFPEVFRGDQTAEVTFAITVTNFTSEPYAVERITLQSMGGGGYSVPVNTRKFGKTIAPGAKESFRFAATAQTPDATSRGPLVIRTTITARAENGIEREEVFTQPVNGRATVEFAEN